MVRLALACFALSALFSGVDANLRGKPERDMCIAPQGSCDPVKDRCCQGPGLMTCRLRPSMVKGDEGTAYVCGEEFPEEQGLTKCSAEGQECRTDDHCCQVDSTLQVTCQKAEKAGAAKVCKAKLMNTGEASELCIAEGHGCNPLENGCCQEGPNGEKGLRTCQLKFFEEPGQHGMAYSCAKELS